MTSQSNLDVSIDMDAENVDVNDNNNQCVCLRGHQTVERELKNITVSANRALAKLDANKRDCQCGPNQSKVQI